MSTFDIAIPTIIHNEGGEYIENDQGRGPSRWGVTLATLKESQPSASAATIYSLTKEQAIDFYRRQFWDKYHISLIYDQELATKVFDLLVNLGPILIKLLQVAVDVGDDGILGAKTAQAINLMPPSLVLFKLRAKAEEHYREIVRLHPEKALMLAGWLARLNS